MTTGAIGPSGPFLADALCRELRRKDRGPWKILEAGPGTGAVTRRLVRYLRPGDSLTAVEINPSLAEFLRKSFRDNPLMADKASQVEVVETDLLKFPGEAIFDSAVCGFLVVIVLKGEREKNFVQEHGNATREKRNINFVFLMRNTSNEHIGAVSDSRE